MPRPRAFDDTVALDACVDQFWDHGFHATSTDDLCTRSGLSRSSLYNAFGKKREVYLRGVRRYGEVQGAVREASVERTAHDSGRDALRAFLAEVLDQQWADHDRRVCFGIHACVDVDAGDDEIRDVLVGNADQFRSVIAGLIARGQQDGSLQRRGDPTDLAAVVHVAIDGLQVASRVRSARSDVDRTVDTLVGLL